MLGYYTPITQEIREGSMDTSSMQLESIERKYLKVARGYKSKGMDDNDIRSSLHAEIQGISEQDKQAVIGQIMRDLVEKQSDTKGNKSFKPHDPLDELKATVA